MTFPSWVADTVHAFGKQLGLSAFALNERGAAGVRFENGRSLYLEGIEGGMMISVGLSADATGQTMRKFLTCAHPSAQTAGFKVRAIRFEKTGEVRFVIRLEARDLTATGLEQAFHVLWQAADTFERATA